MMFLNANWWFFIQILIHDLNFSQNPKNFQNLRRFNKQENLMAVCLAAQSLNWNLQVLDWPKVSILFNSLKIQFVFYVMLSIFSLS